jgi:cytochrome c oxidase subunit II
MPPLVRRKPLVLALLAVLALAVTGVAFASNGGIAPPHPESPNADRIRQSYWLILAVTGAIFILVEGALVLFVFRYRSRGRGRDVEGPQVIGHTRLEQIWTVIPVLILAGIAAFVFYKLPGIHDVPKASASGGEERIDVIAHQFYWEFRYPNGAVSIDELHAPTGRVVRIAIRSQDVDHSWWIPELGGKFDAIPGRTNHTWFRTSAVGTYRGQCGEFCGIYHAVMEARVLVEPPSAYDAFISSGAKTQLGRSLWTGVCAKCHGFKGEGAYGPKIVGSPTLTDPAALRTIVTNGRDTAVPGVMPPVARGWTAAEFKALQQYIQTKVSGGG